MPFDMMHIMRKANSVAVTYDFRNGRASKRKPFNRKTISFVSKSLSDFSFRYKENDTILVNLNFDIILHRPDISAFSSLDTITLYTQLEGNTVSVIKREDRDWDNIETAFYSAIRNDDFESFKILHAEYGERSTGPINYVFRIILKKGRVISASLWIYELSWDPWALSAATLSKTASGTTTTTDYTGTLVLEDGTRSRMLFDGGYLR